ncbi:MAG: hypothetical protein LBU97_02980, partial [Alistipes sp.]|nr:hypothetical protein [Alistipes sp.]
VTVGIALLSSCDNKPPKTEPEVPFPIGVWRTTHQAFRLTVEEAIPESLKEMREHESSVDVSEAESYQLEFKENGTGIGSGVLPDGSGRYDFNFTWSLSDGKISIAEAEPKNEGVFYFSTTVFDGFSTGDAPTEEDIIWKESVFWQKSVEWKVEEDSSDSMVLSSYFQVANSVTDVVISLTETHTYRYTFEKVD